MMVILRSGREVARWYAHESPALPAPMITTSDTARSYIMLKYLPVVRREYCPPLQMETQMETRPGGLTA